MSLEGARLKVSRVCVPESERAPVLCTVHPCRHSPPSEAPRHGLCHPVDTERRSLERCVQLQVAHGKPGRVSRRHSARSSQRGSGLTTFGIVILEHSVLSPRRPGVAQPRLRLPTSVPRAPVPEAISVHTLTRSGYYPNNCLDPQTRDNEQSGAVWPPNARVICPLSVHSGAPPLWSRGELRQTGCHGPNHTLVCFFTFH